MGVPDESDGPVRKRPRLSLRTPHKSDFSKPTPKSLSFETVGENKTTEVNQSSALVKSLDCTDLTADLPSSSDPLVAPVASLHNLGNTCFLNSMLEVLRYTPGFLNGLSRLQEEILAEESKWDKKSSDNGSPGVRLGWQVVKNTYAMYVEMDKKEEQYKEIATSDASSMAVRPIALLDNIRELNPMFEGHFQHDAQELLRCLLCYIEDAEKELFSLRELEDNKAVTEYEVKHTPDVEVIDRGTTFNNDWDSLKGGEGQGMGKMIRQGRRQSGLVQSACVNSTLDCEKNSADSVSLYEKLETENQCNNIDQINASMKINGSDRSISIVDKQKKDEVRTDLRKLSPLRASKNRKRKRLRSSKFASSNMLADVVDHVAVSTCTADSCGLKNAACKDTCAQSDISGNYKNGREVNEETCLEASTFSEFSSLSACDCSEDQTGCPPTGSFSQNKFTPSSIFTNSTKSSTTSLATLSAASETNSSKFSTSILTLFPFNQIKRLGMRGRAIFDSVRRTHQNTKNFGTTQGNSDDDNNNTNSGDVNNNTGSSINNNSCKSKSFGEEKVNIGLSEHQESKHKEMSQFTGSPNKLSPDFGRKNIHLDDEISMVIENEVSDVCSAIDSVTKKYCSTLKQSESKATSVQLPSSSTLSSHMSCAGHAVAPHDISPRGVQSSVSSSVHVLEPDKEISVKVVLSPKKQLPLLVCSSDKSEFLISSDDKMQLPSDDRSKYSVSSCNTYLSGMQDKKKTVSQPIKTISEKLVQDSKNQFPETLQTSYNLTASCVRRNSSCDRLQRRSVYTEDSTLEAKLNLLKQVDGLKSNFVPSVNEQTTQRSPGANVRFCSNSLQPKLELKKCDYLGVSPVRSISARTAMLYREQKKMLENSFSARRKIPTDDSENSSSIESHIELARSYLSYQSSHGIDMDYSSLNTSNESEGKNIFKPSTPAVPPSNAAESETNLKNSQISIFKSARNLQRTPSQGRKLSEHFSHIPVKMRKSNSFLPGNDFSLKPLSVTLDSCDWFLKTMNGRPVSARKAMMVIKKGRKVAQKSKKVNTEVSDLEKRSMVKKMDLSASERSDQLSAHAIPDIKTETNPMTLIEKLFGGTMMHQTKCLECEVARQRQEVFMDISVPVKSLHGGNVNSDGESSDDDERTQDKSGNSCLFKLMQALSKVERLKDANKYFCEQCMHYVEAELSCHYLTLPVILMLHMKRFRSNSRLFGGVSKIVDKVAIPQNLPCLQYHCKTQCSDASHRYSLFAIVTHSGTSILHGHYRAYVKVQPEVNPLVFHNLVMSEVRADENQHSGAKTNISSPQLGSSTSFESSCGDDYKTARSADFDSISQPCDKLGQQLNVTSSARSRNSTSAVHGNTGAVRPEFLKKHPEFEEKPVLGQATRAEEVKSDHASKCENGSFWLECDDECIKVMNESEFADKLEEKDGCLIGTPYVLFYHKLQA